MQKPAPQWPTRYKQQTGRLFYTDLRKHTWLCRGYTQYPAPQWLTLEPTNKTSILRISNATRVRRIDLLIAIRTPRPQHHTPQHHTHHTHHTPHHNTTHTTHHTTTPHTPHHTHHNTTHHNTTHHTPTHVHRLTCSHAVFISYTGCPRRNVPDFGRVFLMLNYTDITQNT